ncbi:DEAD/DEAH box helicase [Acinetobacter soli]|uniref:DEAD/DEAH box helicase n=1 Tax=Acinetobacter soli TaxID=487316 RepID=UPI001C44C406|nr:DEAD/DEAH box helicase [Acinetobacter soli]MBV6552296.1 DEAD/DEAH box helicase [Acinetobacter soli]
MLRIEYRDYDLKAKISWDIDDESEKWLDVIRRLLNDYTDESVQEDGFCITLPWWNFVALRPELSKVFTTYKLKPGSNLIIGSSAEKLLRNSKTAIDRYSKAVNTQIISSLDIKQGLEAIGFVRNLSDKQMRNISKIAGLSAAATFSVPGAGKTTEALAFFFYRARLNESLLVIAPKNAFAAWDEQLLDCVPSTTSQFVRLRGGRERIEKTLSENPRFMLISYQQLSRVSDLIAAYCAKNPTYIFLDESHRIKSGIGKQTARAVLSLSHLPVGKLIMSGTPMPQSIEDLIPQFTFLYPEKIATVDNVVDLIRPVYVRTNKAELCLPPLTRNMIRLQMAPMQYELYKLMKYEVAREAASALTIPNKQTFRNLGRSVARLLQFVSNPALLSSELSFAHPDLLAAVLAEGDGPKLKYVLKRTRQLAKENKKVLIWSSFVRNVEYLAERLADLGAVFIHGGVDAGNEDDDETREGKIKLFHDNPNVQVMIANPAAASEGVSLHKVCHHAIYLDRTFNAAHYLQSEDRIHRFGLSQEQTTTIEIVECIESIDETVRERLKLKIDKMAEALDDSSLRPDPIALDPTDIDDFESYSTGLSERDIEALLTDISKEGN